MLDPILYAEYEARCERRKPLGATHDSGLVAGMVRPNEARIRIVDGEVRIEAVIEVEEEPGEHRS